MISVVDVPNSQTSSWEIFGNAGDSELGLENLKVMLTGPDINAPTTSNPRTRFTPGGLYGFGFSRLSATPDGGAAIEELASQTATLAQCSVTKPKVEVTVYVDTEGSFDADASFEENPDRKPTEDDSSD